MQKHPARSTLLPPTQAVCCILTAFCEKRTRRFARSISPVSWRKQAQLQQPPLATRKNPNASRATGCASIFEVLPEYRLRRVEAAIDDAHNHVSICVRRFGQRSIAAFPLQRSGIRIDEGEKTAR